MSRLHARIVADFGGTHARFATIGPSGHELERIEVLPCADYPTIQGVIRAYLDHQHIDSISEICLAVAGPAGQDVIDLSGLLDQFPELDLEVNKVGIFGTIAKLNKPVKDGDRVEIYRAIHPDAELLEKKS